MPPFIQPEKLEDLSLRALGGWIAKIGEDLMSTYTVTHSQKDNSHSREIISSIVTELRNLIECNIPWMLFDRFGKEVIQSLLELLEKTKKSLVFRGSMSVFVHKMNIAVTMAEVLLTRLLTYVSIDDIPKMMRPVFYTKLCMLQGLRYLNLGSVSGGWKVVEMEPGIMDGLKYLKQLRSLTINYDCTDNILKTACDNCPFLHTLDLSCSKSITNDSINILIKFKYLQIVQLYRTGVTLEGFAKLLCNSRDLRDIGRCDDIGRVLEYIHITNSTAPPFKLTKYVSRYCPAMHLQLTVEMCPYIRNITVFHNATYGDLMSLIGLAHLEHLKLLSCDFYSDQVKQVLQVKGCNIKTLHLEHVDQIDLNALMYISQFCPLLEILTFYNCVLIPHTSLYTKKLEIPPFMALQKLTCVCEITDQQMEFLLSSCKNLRYLHFGTVARISDQLFMKVLLKNPFLYLEELRVIQSEILTMETVNALLSTCPNLKVLVELECWSQITNEDKEHLKDHIKINNMNLNTSPVMRYDGV